MSAQSKSLNRREFQTVATGLFGAGLLGGAQASELCANSNAESNGLDDKNQKLIDAHVHVWTPDTKKYPLAKGYEKKDMRPASFTPEQLMKHAAPAGVNRVVLIQMSYYKFDNSYMLDVMKQFPGVYSGVAVIDENDKPAETMKKLKKQGVRGFRIVSGKKNPRKWLNGEGMKSMWKTGALEKLAMCHLINPEYLPSVAEACKTYPYTPVVIDHFARIGIDGKMRKSDLDNLCALAKFKTVSVKISAYYALGAKKVPYHDLKSMIRRCIDCFGPERLMWASDCPFQVQGDHTYKASIDLIKSEMEDLSESDKAWMLQKTAEKVFF